MCTPGWDSLSLFSLALENIFSVDQRVYIWIEEYKVTCKKNLHINKLQSLSHNSTFAFGVGALVGSKSHSCRFCWLSASLLHLKFSINTIFGCVSNMHTGALLLLFLLRKSAQLDQTQTSTAFLFYFTFRRILFWLNTLKQKQVFIATGENT